MAMSKEDKTAYDALLQRTVKHTSIFYLAPRQSPLKLLLLMMIEMDKATEKLEGEDRWKLKAQSFVGFISPRGLVAHSQIR